MAKQNKYSNDSSITSGDRVTGIDETGGQTKNFRMDAIAEYVKTILGLSVVTIAGQKFILQKHPNNNTNLTTLEINDVILGFDSAGNYIHAQYLGGNSSDFLNTSVYNIFNGI